MEFFVNLDYLFIYPLTVYSLVASETTGNDFLIERHFSLSMNSELDLTLRSCSSLALFRSKPWKIGKYLSVQILFCIFYLVSRICLAKFPVKKLNTLLQLVDLF